MKRYEGHRTPAGCVVTVIDDAGPRPLDARLDLRRHSSDFEWGFAGSGPAQLALALAADVLGDDEKAQEVHQQLKFRLIAGLPENAWTVSEERIRGTIAAIEQQRAERNR